MLTALNLESFKIGGCCCCLGGRGWFVLIFTENVNLCLHTLLTSIFINYANRRCLAIKCAQIVLHVQSAVSLATDRWSFQELLGRNTSIFSTVSLTTDCCRLFHLSLAGGHFRN